MRAVSAAQMRAIDAAAVARDGEVALMRRAGAAIATLVPRYARGGGAVIGIAGSGNNGGDAFAALAALGPHYDRIAYHDPATNGSRARLDARERAHAAGVELRALPLAASDLLGAALVLDGVLGVNAHLPLDPAHAVLVDAMNACGAPVLALDVPTGLDPSTGASANPCVSAVATIALGAPKIGTLLESGRPYAGEVWCDDLGMVSADADGTGEPAFVLTPGEFVALVPKRPADADKRSSGAPLVIAGSAQFPGAAVMCARGAARAGAGYVTVATPASAAAAVRAHLIEQVVVTYDDADPTAAIGELSDLARHSSAIAIGPGIGLGAAMGEIVRGVIAQSDLPLVADASALFHLAKHLDITRGKPMVVTPHAGEFARLSGRGTIAPGERIARLRAFIAEYDLTTLLKGQSTLIADRTALHINPTGTSALATAGTGDVLTGIISTLLAQGLAPIDAARVGAYWHGLAGRHAQRTYPVGVMAGDLPDCLGAALADCSTAPGPVRIA